MTASSLGRRKHLVTGLTDPQALLDLAGAKAGNGLWFEAFDHIAEGVSRFPGQQIPLLAHAWDLYGLLRARHGDRWNLYQGRFFDPAIAPGEKVLDLGSGHHPFPLATHLSDIAVDDGSVGRNGARFENPRNLPVFEFPAEAIPFQDGEFDFLYCSHVLEHSPDPARACREIMRVARRGYLETPTAHKDLWMGSARVSNHTMAVDWQDETLSFRPYAPEELEGLGTSAVMEMHCNPATPREKALAASIWLFADKVNTMLYWERRFRYAVKGSTGRESAPESVARAEPDSRRLPEPASPVPATGTSPRRPLFLQVHPFYPWFLERFHAENPSLRERPHHEIMARLLQEGFSDIHMFAPQMDRLGYCGLLIVPNDPVSQARWWIDNVSPELPSGGDWQHAVLRRQIETLRPEVLYMVDAITWDSKFLRTLTPRPPVIASWRAADIPPGVDWSEIDLFLSGLSGVRDHARTLGARRVEAFHPGFDPAVLPRIASQPRSNDVVFCGSIFPHQHASRLTALEELARASRSEPDGFSLAMHLNAPGVALPGSLAKLCRPAQFGIGMYRLLASGKMTVDIRGNIRSGRIDDPSLHRDTDLARNETMNMRIFEATGCGTFLLAEHYDNLSEYFDVGTEIETFRDTPEMLDKIRFFLRHDSARERIAAKGQERCLREHSLPRRAEAFAERLAGVPGFRAPSCFKEDRGFPTWNLPG